MSDLKPLATEVLLHIAQVLQVPMKGLVASIELLDEGGTVPFIARYRKEATGNLDEVQIRSIEEKLAYFREFQARRAAILAASLAGWTYPWFVKSLSNASFALSIGFLTSSGALAISLFSACNVLCRPSSSDF